MVRQQAAGRQMGALCLRLCRDRSPEPFQRGWIVRDAGGHRILELQDLMIVAVGLNGVVKLLQKIASVTRKEIDSADAALLQALFGIERLTQRFSMARNQFALERFRPGHLGMKTFQLVLDFRTRGFGRIYECAIEFC